MNITIGESDHEVDVACLGETMVQVVPVGGESLSLAEAFHLTHGGAESNVALALARLEDKVSWVSRVGADVLGNRVLNALRAGNVDVTHVRREPTHQTGVFFKDPAPTGSIVTYYRKGSAASMIDSSDVDIALGIHPRVLHMSGVTPALSKSCLSATSYAVTRANQLGIKTSFDVNYRSSLWSSRQDAAKTLGAIADACDIVFVGLDEARSLWGVESPLEIRRLLSGPESLIVKDAGGFATTFSGVYAIRVSALEVDVIEPVGAGDAFAAGWLHGHLRGFDEDVRLRLGHLMARIALSSLTDHGTTPSTVNELETLATSPDVWDDDGARRKAPATR